MDSLLVPSSIQRIRSFLVEICGMKVKPWASPEEALAALHTTLVARHGCPIFWDSLRTLLARLARDMRARDSATPGTVIDNELLSSERYAELLAEIRQSLDRQAATNTSFRQLSAALSGPALSLLLLLGGVASVGCDHSGLNPASDKPDAVLATDTQVPDQSPPPASPDAAAIPKLDTAPATIPLILPDAAPNHDAAAKHDAAKRNADGGMVTIQDIMDSCKVDKGVQDEVMKCLSRLHESWTSGAAETLADAACKTVSDQVSCFTMSKACMTGDGSEFVVGESQLCQPVYIYAGVRFV